MALNIKTSTGAAVAPAPMPTPKKLGESDQIIAQLRKEKGHKSVISGSSIPQVDRIPTGMFEFDLATGGGFPKGRYSIVYGPESSCKTNITYCAIANAQRLPEPCNKAVFVDLEGTFDPKWAAMFGVDTDELIVVKPAYGEEAVDMIDALVRADDVAILVVDSLAVVVASKEIDQSTEKFDVGTASILVKRLCNKLVMALAKEQKRDHCPAVILINQTRFKIGVMFGDPETMPGGQTMKFLASLIIRVNGKNKIVKEINPDLPVFKEVNAVVKKAKVPITKAAFELEICMYPHSGISVVETNSWNKVSNDLKQLGHLEKTSKGWKLTLGKGEVMEATNLIAWQDTYQAEPSFALRLQALILASHKGQMFLLESDVSMK